MQLKPTFYLFTNSMIDDQLNQNYLINFEHVKAFPLNFRIK